MTFVRSNSLFDQKINLQLTILTRAYILQAVFSFVIIFVEAFIVFIIASENVFRQQVQISIDSF